MCSYLHRLLDLMLTPTNEFTISDGVALFNALANNPAANSRVFSFLEGNWTALKAKYFFRIT